MHERAATGSSHAKPGKARFDDIYNRSDPRAYFRTLGLLQYQIPHHAQRVFRALTEARRETRGKQHTSTVLDLCCSYGINPALLNHEVTLEDLYSRYTSPELACVSSAELAALDRAFFAARHRPEAARSIGVDLATNAIGYALEAGLLDEGFSENLENTEPSGPLRNAIAHVDLLTVTGGIGYISERSFQRLMDCCSEPPWVAAFVLRIVSYESIAETLSRYGHVTERLDCTFPQRRFAHEEERRYAIDELVNAGVDVSGREASGYYHAHLYVSRPAWEAAEISLESLISRAT